MPQIRTQSGLKRALEAPRALVIADGKRLDKALSAEEWEPHVVYREEVGHRVMFLLRGMSPLESEDGGESPSSLSHLPRLK